MGFIPIKNWLLKVAPNLAANAHVFWKIAQYQEDVHYWIAAIVSYTPWLVVSAKWIMLQESRPYIKSHHCCLLTLKCMHLLIPFGEKNETPSVCKMVLLISSSALAPFRPSSTLDESSKEPSRLSDRIVVCDCSSSKAFVPIFHFQTSSFWKVTDLFLCIDEREGWERFFPTSPLCYFLYPSFRQPSKVFDKRVRAMLEVPLLHPGQNVNKLTKPHVWA